jgi:hypothetical protein
MVSKVKKIPMDRLEINATAPDCCFIVGLAFPNNLEMLKFWVPWQVWLGLATRGGIDCLLFAGFDFQSFPYYV